MTAKLEPGVVLGGDFEIIRVVGEGGMGAVYEARQRSTGALRAVKTMRADVVTSESAKKRFAQEAQVAAKIESEHVVSVLSAGIDAELGIPWIAMELLKGEDLATMLARGPLDAETAREVFAQLGHALAAAHRAGIVHRDLKPANVFVSPGKSATRKLTVKVLDFGIAKVLGASQATQTGAVGTPLWMAPEQTMRGGEICPATDVWALGLMAFYALTGKHYWLSATDGESVMELLREITLEPIVAASDRATTLHVTLPAGFDAFFEKCVVREIPARYRDAGEALVVLNAVLADAAEAKPAPSNVASPYAKTTPFEDAAAFDATEHDAKRLPEAKTNDGFAKTKDEPDKASAAEPGRSRVVSFVVAGLVIAFVLAFSKLIAPSLWPGTGTPAASIAAPVSPTVHLTGDIFLLGSDAGAEDENPPVRVSVAGYEIDATEVTASDYESCVATGACAPAGKDVGCNYSDPLKAEHPINCVDYTQATAYCKWAGKRLPTETEWEHAARGPTNTMYPWGDAPPTDEQICWRRSRADAGEPRGTCKVGSFPLGNTASGIKDMIGNVWEWTTGRYCPYTNLSCNDERRVLRGGGWASDKPANARATVRQESFENNKSPAIGFRCARSM